MNRLLIPIIWTVALSSPFAASAQNPETRQAVRDKTEVENDTYRKTTVISGPKFDATSYKGGWFIRTWRLPSKLERFQVYVLSLNDQWRFLDRADDKDGNSLHFTAIDKKVDHGHTVEQVGINFDRAYLESHLKSGIDMKISGKRDDILVFIPGYYIAGFLDAVDR